MKTVRSTVINIKCIIIIYPIDLDFIAVNIVILFQAMVSRVLNIDQFLMH